MSPDGNAFWHMEQIDRHIFSYSPEIPLTSVLRDFLVECFLVRSSQPDRISPGKE
jgi:hypothetical protein